METKSRLSNKLLAILLSVVLVITSIPLAAFTVFAANELSFVVKDGNNAISGAKLTVISTKVDDVETNIVSTDKATETANSQGKVSYSELNDYFDTNPNAEVEVEFKVEATGYQTIEKTNQIIVKLDSTEDDLTIEMVSNPVVNLTITGRIDKTIKLYKDSVDNANEISSGTKVEVGTSIIAVPIANDETDGNYNLATVEGAIYDGNYNFTAGTENLDIVFAYTAITYTVKATVTNGKINDITDNGSITINKTQSTTVVTLTPDEHYHLDTLKFGKTGEMADVTDQTTDEKTKYEIDNSLISADDQYEIEATFNIDTYKVTYTSTDNSKGEISLVTENVDLDAIEHGTTLKFKVTPKNNNKVNSVTANGESVAEDLAEIEEFEVEITKETTIEAAFLEVNTDLLNAKKIEDVFNVSYSGDNYYKSDDGAIYLGKNTSVTVTNKSSVSYQISESETGTLYPSGMSICSNENGNNIKEYKRQSKNDNLTSLSVYTKISHIFRKDEYFYYRVPGTIKIRNDSKAPIVSDLNYNGDFTNSIENVSFKVADDQTEKYGDTSYSSGVASVKVTNNKGFSKEFDEITGDGYSFDAPTYIGYTGDVKYTITTTDKVGNKSTKEFTLLNDTEAPTLKEGKAITFSIKNDNVFSQFLSTITFGKWFNRSLDVSINAEDTGVGFNATNAIARIALVDMNNNVIAIKDGKINNEGKAEIEFVNQEAFEGSVYYTICDELTNGEPENTSPSTTADMNGWKLVTKGFSNIGDSNDSSIILMEEDKPNYSFNNFKSENVNPIIKEVNGKKISNDELSFKLNLTDGESNNIISGVYSHIIKINGYEKETIEGEAKQTDLTYSYSTSVTDANEDGSYNINVKNGSLADFSGNISDEQEDVIYYVDKTYPDIVGFDFSLSKNIDTEKNENTDLFDAVKIEDGKDGNDYAFYFMQDVVVTIEAEDVKQSKEIASGVQKIVYVAKGVDIDGKEVVIKGEGLNDDGKTVNFTIKKGFKGQIYAYAIDMVENSPFNSNAASGYNTELLIKDGDYKNHVSPDGAVLEDADMHSKTSSIKFTKIPTAQGTQNTSSEYKYSGDAANKDAEMDYEKNVGDNNVPLYNKDIEFDVTVSDTYSGIREITYTIIEGKEETVKTVKLDNTGTIDGETNGWSVTNTDSNLATEMTNTIAVSGNYNDMVLLVELTDRAGNTSYDYYVFGIDKTAPTISVRYNNNDGDSQSGTGTYFDNHRKATVVITERNFNTENVKWTIKNDEGKAPTAKLVSTKEGTGNKDNTTYTYEINYNYDGVFSFDVSYTDRATNKNTDVDYGNSLAPKAFVVDTVNPTITVSYNNNSAQNEKYFKEYRTATVTIVEHNFDVNRVKFTMTAALSGTAKAIPAISWNHSGDTHVATINYNSDGDYTFDITMEDKSGRKEEAVNYGNSVAAKDFVIDTTYSDIVKVDGVANGDIFGLRDDGSINDAAEIKITFNDVNFDKYSIHLYRNRVLVDGISENANSDDKYEEKDVITTANKNAVENNADVTEDFIGSVANGSSNTTVTFDIPAVDENKVKNDGMYTLRIEANDKAGNAYDTNSNVITFAVNRYGSVYTVDDDLYNLINDNEGYTQAIAGDIVIREYNTTDVTTNKLSILRGTTPLEGVECKPAAVSQTGVEWHEYTYKVDKSYFMDGDKYVDGEYSLIISSTDKADIKSTNDKYDTCQVGFVLDTTAPKINGITPSAATKDISLDNYLEIASDEDVTFTVPVTDNLRLSTVEVFIGDTSDNATPAYVYTYTGDKVEINADKGGTFDEQTRFDDCSFTLSPGTSKQNFRVRVTDKVGLTIDTADFESGKVAPGFEGFFSEVLITSNWFVRMWNRPVFKIALASGLLAAAAGSVFIIIGKKRRKNDNETQSAE